MLFYVVIISPWVQPPILQDSPPFQIYLALNTSLRNIFLNKPRAKWQQDKQTLSNKAPASIWALHQGQSALSGGGNRIPRKQRGRELKQKVKHLLICLSHLHLWLFPFAVTSCKPLHYWGYTWVPDSITLNKQTHDSGVKFEICQETVSAVCQWMELPCQTLPMPLAPDHTSQLSLLSVLVSLFKEIRCASHCWVYNKEVWNPWNWVVWSKIL